MTCHPSHTRGAGADEIGADEAAADVQAQAKKRPLCGLEGCDCGHTIEKLERVVQRRVDTRKLRAPQFRKKYGYSRGPRTCPTTIMKDLEASEEAVLADLKEES